MSKNDGGSAMTVDLESLRGHTTGKWFVVQFQASVGVCTAEDGGYSERVAECCHWSQPAYGQPDRAAALANANLIAAAPSMLSELTARRARDAEVEALVAACRLARSYMSEAIEYETPCAKRDGANVDAALLPFVGDKP